MKGHGVSLAMVAMSAVVFAFMSWYFTRRNEQRRNGKEDAKIADMSEDQIAELGDESPRYIFTV